MQIGEGKWHMAEGDGIFRFFFFLESFMVMLKCDVLLMLRVAHVALNFSKDNLIQQTVLFSLFLYHKKCDFTEFGNPSIRLRNILQSVVLPLAVL